MSEEMTITEALAEVKLTLKKVQTKRDFIKAHIVQMSNVIDPLQDHGGSRKVLDQEQQSVKDLMDRLVRIRSAIHSANSRHAIPLEGEDKTIADWLVWRREVADIELQFYRELKTSIETVRKEANSRNYVVSTPDAHLNQAQVTVFLSEKKLTERIEKVQNILGQLDGKLSLFNATIRVVF